jgi:hypothetical protein
MHFRIRSCFRCCVGVCPVGDDPMTSGQLNEIQLLKCTATTGTFTLQFGLATSEPIAWDASAQTVVNTLRVSQALIGCIFLIFSLCCSP